MSSAPNSGVLQPIRAKIMSDLVPHHLLVSCTYSFTMSCVVWRKCFPGDGAEVGGGGGGGGAVFYSLGKGA